MTQLSRTEFRRRSKYGNQGPNPNDAWVAPEHMRVSSCRRLKREVKAEDGTVLIPKNTLVMPEPSCLLAQRESERILRMHGEAV